MDTISNKEYTESEFNKWLNEMKKANVDIITVSEVRAKMEQLAEAKNYTYTAEDISQMLEEKRKAGRLPVNLATEKARLIALREVVRETDKEEYENICERLAEIERLLKEKALLVTKEEQVNNALDPFARRKSQPRASKAAKPESEQQSKHTLGNSSDTILDPSKQLINEHNSVDIDIAEIPKSSPSLTPIPTAQRALLLPTPLSPSPVTPPPSSDTHSKTPTLSLADYIRRRRALE